MLCLIIPIVIVKNKLFISSILSTILALIDRRYVLLYLVNNAMSIINFLRDGL